VNSLEERGRSIVAQAAKKIRPVEYIRTEVRLMDPEDIVDLATAYLLAQVKQNKRANVRVIERDAQRALPPVVEQREREPRYGTRAWDAWAAREANHEAAEQTRDLRRAYARIDAETMVKKLNFFQTTLEEYKKTVIMEWTTELLNSEFALGDGTTTTWGDATREQHEARMELHGRNALAGMEGYARHAAAVEELERTGAESLREALAVAA
jgi:hypothetical protein